MIKCCRETTSSKANERFTLSFWHRIHWMFCRTCEREWVSKLKWNTSKTLSNDLSESWLSVTLVFYIIQRNNTITPKLVIMSHTVTQPISHSPGCCCFICVRAQDKLEKRKTSTNTNLLWVGNTNANTIQAIVQRGKVQSDKNEQKEKKYQIFPFYISSRQNVRAEIPILTETLSYPRRTE